jgi:ABC-2 type transport system permease protein
MSWRRLRTLLVREVRASFRDPFTVTVLIAVPLIALLLFGYVLSTEVQRLPLAVLDADNSVASRTLVAELAAPGTFIIERVEKRSDIDQALVDGQVSAALVIPPGFARGLGRVTSGGPPPQIELVYDGAEAVLAGNAEGFLRSMVAATGGQLVERGATTGKVSVVTRALYNPTLEGVPFMVAGTFGFVLSFLTTLITAVSVVNERMNGTFDQLQVTPATSLEIFLGKLLPLGAMFTFDVVLMVVVAGLVLGVWPNGNPLLFIGISAFYVQVSLALGLIFSATSETAGAAVQKTVLFSVPLVQLSGFVFPIRNMPLPVQWGTELFPATHYIRISRAIYIRAEGLYELLPDIVPLALFATVLTTIALRTIGARR